MACCLIQSLPPEAPAAAKRPRLAASDRIAAGAGNRRNTRKQPSTPTSATPNTTALAQTQRRKQAEARLARVQERRRPQRELQRKEDGEEEEEEEEEARSDVTDHTQIISEPNPNSSDCNRENEPDLVSIGYLKKGLNLSPDEANRLREIETERVLADKKLFLVLDLDNTLIDSVDVKNLIPEEKYLEHHLDSVTEVPKGNLFNLKIGSLSRMVKIRPSVRFFLEEASTMFQMILYSKGQPKHVTSIAKLLDPEGRFFGTRILSRDDSTFPHEKNLDVVMAQERAVLVVDDLDKVWPNNRANLVRVRSYGYFARSSVNKFRSHAEAHSVKKTDESEIESESYLKAVLKVLKEVHTQFFDPENGLGLADRDVRNIKKNIHARVLKGCCKILFSNFPEEWVGYLLQLAEEMGAVCAEELDSTVTHVVTVDPRIEDIEWAREDEKNFLVSTEWLFSSYYHWRKMPEEEYRPDEESEGTNKKRQRRD